MRKVTFRNRLWCAIGVQFDLSRVVNLPSSLREPTTQPTSWSALLSQGTLEKSYITAEFTLPASCNGIVEPQGVVVARGLSVAPRVLSVKKTICIRTLLQPLFGHGEVGTGKHHSCFYLQIKNELLMQFNIFVDSHRWATSFTDLLTGVASKAEMHCYHILLAYCSASTAYLHMPSIPHFRARQEWTTVPVATVWQIATIEHTLLPNVLY